MSRIFVSPRFSLLLYCILITLSLTITARTVKADTTYAILTHGMFEYFEKALLSRELGVSDFGEDGVLPMRPETALSYGLQVYEDENYRTFREKLGKADEFLDRAIKAMKTRGREKKKWEHVATVAHFACLYQKTMQSAKKDLEEYRATLPGKKDERFDKKRCASLVQTLLKEGLSRNSRNLRDAIGYVYNKSHAVDPYDGFPLTPENIRFVNYVFSYFLKNGTPQELQKCELDRVFSHPDSRKWDVLEKALGGMEQKYLRILRPVFSKERKQGKYVAEPLLFLALMRQESRFDPLSVSQVGAAGITQIMPSTGTLLGMKTIFDPPYLKEARKLLLKERSLRATALRLVKEPEEFCRKEDAKRARHRMQQALVTKKKRKGLYGRYKRELLSRRKDDRLDPRKAIDAGYRLFSELMREQQGDISLALAAYNAGSRSVKKYNGLPPYAETVTFRNRILRYYRQYLARMGWLPEEEPSGQ